MAGWLRRGIGATMRSTSGVRRQCFRRSAAASERPEFQVVKRPELRHKQGMYALIGEAGAVLKRGTELGSVLAPLERKLVKLVGD